MIQYEPNLIPLQNVLTSIEMISVDQRYVIPAFSI
jgi:hypothetical protein